MRNSIKGVALRIASASIVVVALGAGVAGVASAGSFSPSSFGSHDHDHDGDNRSSALNVTALTPTLLSVAGSNNVTTTYTLTSNTTYFEGTQSATFAALALGEQVHVTTSTAAPTTAVSVTILLAHVEGSVTAISGTTFTLSPLRGVLHTVIAGANTTYSQNGVATTVASVLIGSEIKASGTLDATGTSLNALQIEVAPVHTHELKVEGKVSAVSATSLTLLEPNATSQSFALSSSTTFREGSLAATIGSLRVGEKVVVVAQAAPSTSSTPSTLLNAQSVQIVLVTLRGTVTSFGADEITITSDQGFSDTILVGGDTQYRVGSVSGTLASVLVGSSIVAQGNVDSNLTSLDALVITVEVATSHEASSDGSLSSQYAANGHSRGHAQGHSTHPGARH